jgi:hypothetical protein
MSFEWSAGLRHGTILSGTILAQAERGIYAASMSAAQAGVSFLTPLRHGR